ncbi:MAG: hypothetical protein NW215_15850 [Hyphomicrobiales bacterium]|nr:hypothetical protein [Hyphomicrobiales bacterium]
MFPLRQILRLGSWPDNATIDYYLAGAFRADAALRRVGPNTFQLGDRLIVVRYITERELRAARASRWRGVNYVVDDVLPAAAACADLPADYRARLAAFAHTLLPEILALSPTVLAPTRTILDLFPSAPRAIISPCMLGEPSPRPHGHWNAPLRIAFFGTRSHASSLPFLEAVADRVRRRAPSARLTMFFGRHAPSSLQRAPNVQNLAPMKWPEFRRMLTVERFHIGLAPLADTLFARGRSITKALDHASAGVAGLYSEGPTFAGAVTHGRTGLLLPMDADVWAEEIARLDRDRAALEALAQAGVERGREVGDPAKLRAFWRDRAGV